MPDNIITTADMPMFRNRSASIAALAEALAAAQRNFATIPKDREVKVTTRTGGSYTFRYATMDAILSATMPALAEQSLAISQALSSWGDHYAVETTLYHKSGEWISNVTPMFVSGRQGTDGKTYPPGNQELGSAQTYARRYGVSALLCITADEDDDGNSADGNQAEGKSIPFKPGARGTAGGGTQFRPERRSPGMAQTESLRVDPADRDMVRGDGRKQYEVDKAKKAAASINTPAAAGSAIKRIEWVKTSIAYLADKDEHVARDWWAENKERIAVIETALPTEYERLLDTYNEAIERKVPA